MVRLYRRKVALLGLVSAFLLAQQALAAVFIIADGDVPGLKNAIVTANSNGEADTIYLATNGHYLLTTVDNTTDGPSGLPVITNDNAHLVLIAGNGATISRDASAPAFRIFTIAGHTQIDQLTISNGSCGSANYGGGVYDVEITQSVSLTLTSCTLSGNFATFGGALATKQNAVQLSGCTLVGNSAQDGGGFYNYEGSVDLHNCTLTGNTASSLGPAVLSFGGVSGNAYVYLTSCTLNNNGIFLDGASATTYINLANCILNQSPVGYQLSGGGILSTFDQGYNLSSGDPGNSFFYQATDQINTDPGLDPAGLQNNGGPTKTIALAAGSAAIDAGKSFGLTTDQRGVARPYDNSSIPNAAGGDGSDIGAYEAPQDLKQNGNPSFIVTTTDDHSDSGQCTVGDCSLREAVLANHNAGGGKTITFAAGVTGTINLQTSVNNPLFISEPIHIQGPGARVLAISGQMQNRIFSISNSANTTSSISGLTIRDGYVLTGLSFAGAEGGAIFNSGGLTITDCSFLENKSQGVDSTVSGGGGGNAYGGAIYSYNGSLTLTRCSFIHNTVLGGAGGANGGQFGSGGVGGAAEGAAVFFGASGFLTATECTFYNNIATGGTGGNGAFGGNGGDALATVYNTGSALLTADTISGNTNTGGGGGLGNNSINNGAAGAAKAALTTEFGNTTVANTIVAANNASGFSVSYDVDGAFTSNGFNFIGSADHSSGFGTTGDQTGTDAARLNPMLGAAQNNGGPTDTMALLTGSSAIDQGKAFGLTIDQRGFPRPLEDPAVSNATGGDGSDIGAFERDPPQVFATLTVNTAADHDDGVCSQLDCTLREAINAANSLAGDNVITFAPAVTGVIQLTSALPNVSTNVAIQGPGARVLAVSGNNAYRPFFFTGGSSSISGLTIRDGHVTGGFSGSVQGGGIYNQATLSLSQCTVKNNVAQGGFALTGAGDGGSGSGGGLYNVGILTLDRCTFSGNAAGGGKGGDASRALVAGRGGAANGGALCNDAGGNLTLSECTFSANTGTGGNGGNGGSTGGNGGPGNGGIYTNGTVILTSCTVSGNTGTGGTGGTGTTSGLDGTASGGVRNGGTATIRNTISAANTPSDVNGAFTSQGYNLIGPLGSATGFTATGDQTGVSNPRLSALQNNGGSTDTMVPLVATPASGAIDKGNRFALTYDQRNQLRTLDSPFFSNASGGDGTDIGAVEFSPMTGTDSDGDGMSDDFELFYGFNPSDPSDGAKDSDGDGLTNAQECQAGTNPLDPNSNLRIVAVARAGNDFSVTFSLAVADKTYRLERKDAATDATWNSINGVSDLTPTFSGSGQITDPGGASTTKRFYRVRLLP